MLKKIIINSVVILLLIFNYLFIVIYQVSDYFTGFGFNEAVIYHVFYGLNGFDIALYLEQGIIIIAITLVIIILSIFLSNKYIATLRHKSFFIILLLVGLLLQPLSNNLFTHFGSPFFNRSFVGNLKPVINKNIQLQTKRNLVFIYAESLERSFLNNKKFPNLTPNLNQLAKQGLDFSNIGQTYGATSTIAGMVASQCGVPFNIDGIIDASQPFLPSLYCLGDILSENQYNLTYMGGASLDFAEKGNFYKSHSFNKVIGRESLKHKLIDKNYLNRWGIYDDELFNYAAIELQQLLDKQKKYALFLLTLDTHAPDYFASKTCSSLKYLQGDNKQLNAVHCSDQKIYNFVAKINQLSADNPPIIIIASDHLSPDRSLLPSIKIRRNLLIILNSGLKPKIYSKRGSTLDTSLTLLNLLGANIQRNNFGVNLLSEEVSLIKKEPDIDKQFINWTPQLRKFN